jgi:hypothetical protein
VRCAAEFRDCVSALTEACTSARILRGHRNSGGRNDLRVFIHVCVYIHYRYIWTCIHVNKFKHTRILYRYVYVWLGGGRVDPAF